MATVPEDRAQWVKYRVLDVKVPGVAEEGKGSFVGLQFVVGGRRYTLDEIENGVLLQRPDWVSKDPAFYAAVGVETPDPRIHLALVCAAKGCVKLRREAYEGSSIDDQLDDAVRAFVRDRQGAVFDRAKRAMLLTQLLDWYGQDFTDPRFSPHEESVAKFLARYVDDSDLARSPSKDRWKTTFIEYDWSLNARR